MSYQVRIEVKAREADLTVEVEEPSVGYVVGDAAVVEALLVNALERIRRFYGIVVDQEK